MPASIHQKNEFYTPGPHRQKNVVFGLLQPRHEDKSLWPFTGSWYKFVFDTIRWPKAVLPCHCPVNAWQAPAKPRGFVVISTWHVHGLLFCRAVACKISYPKCSWACPHARTLHNSRPVPFGPDHSGGTMSRVPFFPALVLLFVLALTGCQVDKAVQAAMLGIQAETISDADVKELGKLSAADLDRKSTIASSSSSYTKRLNSITSSLTTVDGMTMNYKVYMTNELNAFALPDGSVRVYSGLMDKMTDDELLFIIGHEIGHVKYGHSASRMRNAYRVEAARAGLSAAGGAVGAIANSSIGDIGRDYVNAQYSQKNELEADKFGAEILTRKGKSLDIGASALRKLGGGGGGAMSSHPDSEERAKKIEAMKK